MERLPRTPGRLGWFGGCIQPAIGRTTRLPRRRRRSARGTPGVPSLRDLTCLRQETCPARTSIDQAIFPSRSSTSLRFPQDANFDPCGPPGFLDDFVATGRMGHSLAEGPRRSVRARAHSHAGHLQRLLKLGPLPSPRRSCGRRTHGDVLAKRSRRAMGFALGSLLELAEAAPFPCVVLPIGRMPQLRKRLDRRRTGLRARAVGPTSRRQRAHLLLNAKNRRRARSLK